MPKVFVRDQQWIHHNNKTLSRELFSGGLQHGSNMAPIRIQNSSNTDPSRVTRKVQQPITSVNHPPPPPVGGSLVCGGQL